MDRLFIATAGWNVSRERAASFASEGTCLQKYASVLGATEINSTFYRRHRPATFERWRDSVPSSFRFAVKMPRAITHEAALVSARSELTAFFGDIRGLGAKLGPILVQLPASLDFDARTAASFFRLLRRLHSGPVACEPRNPSWYVERAADILLEHDIGRVVADPPRPPEACNPAGSPSLRYIRWHGSPRLYWSLYGDERLVPLRDAVVSESTPAAIWCVFDNTASGAAIVDALRFRELVADAEPAQNGRTRAAKSSEGKVLRTSARRSPPRRAIVTP